MIYLWLAIPLVIAGWVIYGAARLGVKRAEDQFVSEQMETIDIDYREVCK